MAYLTHNSVLLLQLYSKVQHQLSKVSINLNWKGNLMTSQSPQTVASLQTIYLQHKTSLKSFRDLLFSIRLVCTFVLNLVNRETDDRHLHNFCFAQITKLSQTSKQNILLQWLLPDCFNIFSLNYELVQILCSHNCLLFISVCQTVTKTLSLH